MTEEEVKALQETNKELVDRVGFLEKDLAKAITKRDEAKQALEDNTGDEELRKELDNYKAQLTQVEADKEAIKEGYTSELNSLQMITQLKELGVETHNMDALNAVSELVLQDAVYDNGGFKFLNEDGTTKFNQANKDYSIQDKINELKEGDKGYLFKAQTGGGKDNKTPDAPPSTDINSIIDAGLKY